MVVWSACSTHCSASIQKNICTVQHLRCICLWWSSDEGIWCLDPARQSRTWVRLLNVWLWCMCHRYAHISPCTHQLNRLLTFRQFPQLREGFLCFLGLISPNWGRCARIASDSSMGQPLRTRIILIIDRVGTKSAGLIEFVCSLFKIIVDEGGVQSCFLLHPPQCAQWILNCAWGVSSALSCRASISSPGRSRGMRHVLSHSRSQDNTRQCWGAPSGQTAYNQGNTLRCSLIVHFCTR